MGKDGVIVIDAKQTLESGKAVLTEVAKPHQAHYACHSHP